MADSISAIPQQPFLGRLAEFLRFLEKDRPEFLPSQLGVMQGISKLALPQASTIENLSYGNQPFTMPPSGTGAMIPQAKTGRKAEIADLVGMITGGVPGAGAVAGVGTKLSNEAADALVRAITRNPQATAPGVLQETAMPFMQAVAPKMPGLLQAPAKSDLGFYSALEQATMPLQNKGTGSQFLAQIEKTAGVKPEEVKWTGLDEFLKSRQNVTKQDVQDYLAANRVNLQERRLAGDGGQSPVFAEYFPDTQKFHVFSNDLRLQGLYNTAEEADAFVKQYNASIPYGPSKFSKYTLPGGENYREILLTLPTQDQRIAGRIGSARLTPEEGSRFRELETLSRRGEANQSQIDELNRLEQRVAESQMAFADARRQDPRQDFISTHFNQPNILAHMRVNDRVVDGKKTLFIEEIQSDWHQAGRKKGYAGADTKNAEAAFKQYSQELADKYNLNPEQNLSMYATMKGMQPEEVAKYDELQSAWVSSKGGVPDAPFKTTWHELTLKRAIQEASEKGYDQIAFTTGKTQAERYDLSKQVDEINVTARTSQISGEQIRTVALDTIDGQSIKLAVQSNGIVGDVSSPSARNFVGQNLSDIVGKELAEKIMKEGSQTISGEGLRVGGKGMEGFYDQILPKSLEKLGKKFDAKVGKTEMDGVEVWQMDITPKMRESVLTKGQPLFAATPAVGLLGRDEEE